MVHIFGLLPCVYKTWMKCLAYGPDLAGVGIWAVNQGLADLCLFPLPLCVCPSNKSVSFKKKINCLLSMSREAHFPMDATSKTENVYSRDTGV